jgi:hypothetical protein
MIKQVENKWWSLFADISALVFLHVLAAFDALG